MGFSFKGRGGGGGVLGLGPIQNTFGDNTTADRAAAEALRNTYAGANAAWLKQYDDNLSFWIRLVWNGGAIEQRRNAAGNAWEDVTNVIRGEAGGKGDQGTPAVWYARIFLNDDTDPAAAPVGGSIAADRSVTPPAGGWAADTSAPGAGENTYESIARVDPAADTFPLVPTWQYPFEIGNPAGAQAARAAAEAAATRAEAAQAAAESAEMDAETAQAEAETARTEAQAANTQAQTARTQAQAERTAAETAKTDAEQAEAEAETARTEAQAAKTAAEQAEQEAEAAASTAQADSDGTPLYGAGMPDNSLGKSGDSYTDTNAPHAEYKKVNDAWVLQFTPQGGGGGTPATHSEQYLALKAGADPFVPDDFTGGNGVAFAANSHTATAPNTPDGNVRLGLARLASDPAPTFLDINATGLNQFGALTRQAGTLDIGGDTYDFWEHENALPYQGASVEFR